MELADYQDAQQLLQPLTEIAETLKSIAVSLEALAAVKDE